MGVAPGGVGDVDEQGTLRNDDGRGRVLLDVSKVAGLESDGVGTVDVDFESALEHVEDFVVVEGPFETSGRGVFGEAGGKAAVVRDDGVGRAGGYARDVQVLEVAVGWLYELDHSFTSF